MDWTAECSVVAPLRVHLGCDCSSLEQSKGGYCQCQRLRQTDADGGIHKAQLADGAGVLNGWERERDWENVVPATTRNGSQVLDGR